MPQSQKQSNVVSLLLIGLLFSIFGFVTWLNGILIKFLKTACQLNNSQASLVTFAFFISYFVMALPSSVILRKTGFKNGMGLGLIVMAAGCLCFIPAAYQRNYLLFLTGLFTQGLGLAILQTASNPYVTIVGPIESAARRISLMGICNKLAGALGSIVLGKILLDPMGAVSKQIEIAAMDKLLLLDRLAHKIIVPYTVMAVALLVVAVFIRLSPLPDVKDEEQDMAAPVAGSGARPLSSYIYLWLGALAIFVYVGVEVLAGDYIISFGAWLNQQHPGAVPDAYIKYLTSLTLSFMLAGYALGVVLIPKVISQETALRLNAVGGLLLVLGVLSFSGKEAVFCLAFLGFFHAVMWPAIWPMSIKGLGQHTKTGSAILIMGIAGGAVVPFLYSAWADARGNNLQQPFLIMIPCYLYILFFALKGHKIGYRPAAPRQTEAFDVERGDTIQP